MSLVDRTMLVRLLFRDNDRAEANSDVNIPSSTDIASALSFMHSWRVLVVALSSAACFETNLYVRRSETGLISAAPGSDVLRSGVFIFNNSASQLATIRLPSIDPALLETTGPFAGVAINQSLSAVSDLLSATTAGISGVQPCDPFGYDLVSVSTAYKEQS